jgi:hypothetical protein
MSRTFNIDQVRTSYSSDIGEFLTITGGFLGFCQGLASDYINTLLMERNVKTIASVLLLCFFGIRLTMPKYRYHRAGKPDTGQPVLELRHSGRGSAE